jgi:hypothetical protein
MVIGKAVLHCPLAMLCCAVLCCAVPWVQSCWACLIGLSSACTVCPPGAQPPPPGTARVWACPTASHCVQLVQPWQRYPTSSSRVAYRGVRIMCENVHPLPEVWSLGACPSPSSHLPAPCPSPSAGWGQAVCLCGARAPCCCGRSVGCHCRLTCKHWDHGRVVR